MSQEDFSHHIIAKCCHDEIFGDFFADFLHKSKLFVEIGHIFVLTPCECKDKKIKIVLKETHCPGLQGQYTVKKEKRFCTFAGNCLTHDG